MEFRSTYLLFGLLAMKIALIRCVKHHERFAGVAYDENTGEYFMKTKKQDGMLAWGTFSNRVNETGWSYLEVHTNGDYSDSEQAWAAGIIEGHLTAEFIAMHWTNTLSNYCSSDVKRCTKVKDYLDKNLKFVTESIKNNPQDKYWYQVGLVYEQLRGLQDGYNESEVAKTNPMTPVDFMLLQVTDSPQDLGADLIEISPDTYGHCSALIKLLPNNTDLLISHNTWTNYSTMLRVYKMYELQFRHNTNKNLHIEAVDHSFSSYPGLLFSLDDYYMLSSGLVVQETTNFNYNPELLRFVTPENTVHTWVRALIANRLAKDGLEWVGLFAKYNSGTYNNQWMVLNYNKFTVGEPLQPGTLWILEQIPGMVEMADMTIHLQANRYWASYNVPYFPTIYNTSGFPDMVKKYGTFYDHDLTPRAQIFRRNHSDVIDIASMLKLMRSNNFEHDELSKCDCRPPYNAAFAIAARCDLNLANGTYPENPILMSHIRVGATDVKITSSKMFKDFTVLAVSGPTFDQQPVFQWSTSGWSKPAGHPDKFDFQPVFITWGQSEQSEHKLTLN